MQTMIGKTFWQDASVGGAVLGLVNLAEVALSVMLPSAAGVVSIASLIATIYLIIYFTRKRVPLYGHYGFSYGQSMDFIVVMGLFAGVMQGAGQVILANFLFTDYYNELLIATQQQMRDVYSGMLKGEQMTQMMEWSRKAIFSPAVVLVSNIYSNVIGKAFLGLFASLVIKRDPDIFYNDNGQ